VWRDRSLLFSENSTAGDLQWVCSLVLKCILTSGLRSLWTTPWEWMNSTAWKMLFIMVLICILSRVMLSLKSNLSYPCLTNAISIKILVSVSLTDLNWTILGFLRLARMLASANILEISLVLYSAFGMI